MKSAIFTNIFASIMLTPLTLALPAAHPEALAAPEPESIPFTLAYNSTIFEERGFNGDMTKRSDTGGFQTFSGASCDGSASRVYTVGRGRTCVANPDSHSFALYGPCTRYDITAWSDATDCHYGYTSQFANQGCYTVNTGKNWQSTWIQCID